MEELVAENVTFKYKDSDKYTLHNLSFSINRNEFVTIIAPSGTGKSTLFNLLLGKLKVQGGIIKFQSDSVIGYMPQRDCLMDWRNIIDNASIGLEIQGHTKKEARKITNTYFDEFGLEGTQKKYPNQLSGGMRQRVSFLRAIVNKPSLLLLDEPFSSLDSLTRQKMQYWLLNLFQKEASTVFMITHDIDEAIILSDRILISKDAPFEKFISIDVNIKRPRTHDVVFTDEFIKVKRDILKILNPEFFNGGDSK